MDMHEVRNFETGQREAWREVLERAADLVERGGHCKGALTRDGAFCLVGAIHYASSGDVFHIGEDPQALVAWGKLEDRIGAFQFTAWNNAPERTAAEVIATLREVARS